MSKMDEPDFAPSFVAEKPRDKCFVVQNARDPDPTEIYFAKSRIEAVRWFANEHGDGDREIAGISARREKQWDHYAPGPVPKMELIDAGWWMECHGCGVRIDIDAVGTSEPYTSGYDYEDYELDREYGPDLTLPICDPYEPKPGAIWCRKQCHDDDKAERRRIKRMERRAVAIVEAAALRRWPGIEIVRSKEGYHSGHVYVWRDSSCGYLLIVDVRVAFTFPGATVGGGTLAVRTEKWEQSYIIDSRPWQPSDGYDVRRRKHRAPLSMRTRDVELWMSNGDKAAWNAWRGALSLSPPQTGDTATA